MDVSASIDEYLSAKQNSITRKTFTWYRDFLHAFAKWCKQEQITDLSQITVKHVQQFVSAGKTTNTNTRHHRAQIVKGFLNWCSHDPDLGVKEAVIKRIEMPRRVQPDVVVFTPQEINALLAACEQTRHPLRNKAILHILLDTGIRASELAFDGDRPEEETGLRLEHLIFGRAGESYVQVVGKGWKPRSIGIGHETTLAVKRYLNRERGQSRCPYVFLERTGTDPLSVRMLQQLLEQLGRIAKVPDCHPHRFRHTFSINQLLNGTSSLVLMQLLGHSTLESTKIYTWALTQLQARKAASSVVDTMRGTRQVKRSWHS